MTDFQTKQSATLQTFLDESQKALVATQNAYNEQMRLSQPAQYWKELEEKYNAQGKRWAWVTAGAVAAAVGLALVVAYQPPAVLKATEVSLPGIKGAVLIAAAISSILYLVNLFVKLCISCFHLARDASERRQLTHVYLALIKEKGMEPPERQVILQALFSRADTGLLKGDSGPAIPTPAGNIIEVFGGKK